MLDPETFDRTQPNNVFIPTIKNVVKTADVTEEQLLTVTSVVYGFCLGDKIWGNCYHHV